MIYFISDYSQGAHPKVLEALEKTNLEHSDGYGIDIHSQNAERLIKEMTALPEASVHMMVGGTPTNIITIASALKPYEAVVAPKTGHIYSHETGAIEATGHRIITMETEDGKLRPEHIDEAWDQHEDEHTLLPKMVYISQPTEIGTLYSKSELEALRKKTLEKDMYLYIDGARLGTALTAEENDLRLEKLAALCDAFYIGGTKNGALFGEALVVNAPEINDHFRYMIKRQGGMFAKGRLLGVQFEALLDGNEESIFFEMADHANKMAKHLIEGLEKLGVEFVSRSQTNQVFPILPKEVVEKLEEEFAFYHWAPEKNGMIPIRLVTSWGTREEEIEEFLTSLKDILGSYKDD